MAVNKTINKRTNTHGAMRNCIEYVLRQDKTSELLTYITGPYCHNEINYDLVYRTFLEEKKMWNKDTGRMYAHNIISWHKDEQITPEQAFEFGKEFAENWFSGFQTLVAVHKDKDHIHFHLVFYCGDCKRKMCTRRCKGNVYYFCNAAWYRDERKCSHKSISEEKLQKIVRSELTRQFQLSGLRKKDMSAISSAVFLSKINEIQTEIRKLDADMERRSEKLAQAFMKYKEGELSKEAYIEMKDDRNNWKEFCEERKKSLEQTIRKLEKQQKEEARFLRSLLELDGTTRINAELAEGLIESMYLYGDGRLEINFGFKGAVEHE